MRAISTTAAILVVVLLTEIGVASYWLSQHIGNQNAACQVIRERFNAEVPAIRAEIERTQQMCSGGIEQAIHGTGHVLGRAITMQARFSRMDRYLDSDKHELEDGAAVVTAAGTTNSSTVSDAGC